MKLKTAILVVQFFVFVSVCMQAQTVSISGKLIDKSTREPLYYGAINLEGTPIYDLSKEDGTFELKNIEPGKYVLLATILGYQTYKKEIVITASIKHYNIYISKSSLALDEVVINATVAQSKEGSTTYKIGQEAIQQIQPISVSDILQLLPGSKIGQTDMNAASQANLRNVGGYDGINSFGTSVIIDGNQLSNDGNMQSDGLNSTANKGVDLRKISASNIESVEVISGVASARYGDITSGAVIVKQKAGYTPLNVSFNTTPTSYQLGVNKGIKLVKGGFINLDTDYTYSNSATTSRKNYYQRINTGIRWTNEIVKSLAWNNNLSFRYGQFFDGQRPDSDEKFITNEKESKDQNLVLSLNGNMRLLGKTSYSFNGNYTHQYAYKKLSEGGPKPIIESLEAGTHIVKLSPVQFYQRTEFYGDPVNINARIENEQTFKTGFLRHNTSIGLNYAYDKNFGKGRVLDKENNVATPNAGARAMNFYNLPASEKYSAYAQDDINIQRDKANYLFKLGLRYDYLLKKYHHLSPRLSFSAKYFEKLRFRLAYGIAYKTPSMLQLYPGPTYFDVINLSHYSEDDIRSAAVVTTYIHQPVNDNIKASKGTTFEGGIDFEDNGFSFRLTGFYKKLEDGISGVSQLITVDNVQWISEEEIPGQVPVFVPTDKVIRESIPYQDFRNTITINTKGAELSLQFPQIKASHTTFNLSGSYLQSNSRNESLTLKSSASAGGASLLRYGLYEQPAYQSDIMRTTLTIAQHVPEIKLLLTLRAEANWIDKKEMNIVPSPYPFAYYDINSNYVEIPENERANIEYEGLHYNIDKYRKTPVPSYFNFHLQLRKETKQGHSLSFYATNVLWYNPTYESDPELSNTIEELNSRITFGLGFSFKL